MLFNAIKKNPLTKVLTLCLLLVVCISVQLGPIGFGNPVRANESKLEEPPTNITPAKPEAVKNQYIVILKEAKSRVSKNEQGKLLTVSELAQKFAKENKGSVLHTYESVFEGFAISLPVAGVSKLRANPDVSSIDPDYFVYPADKEPALSWGLDRIDQRSPIQSTILNSLSGSYEYPSHGGSGVHVYVIDSGIRSSHSEFTGRIGNGYYNVGNSVEDCLGHGTHVTGIIAGTKYGVAKKVVIHPVRVFGCENFTPTSKVIEAVEWVIKNASRPAVINMSLGGRRNSPSNRAVERAVASGIPVVVAAMNDGVNVSTTSPASSPDVLTVGSTTKWDMQNTWSNYGAGVDLHAPGYQILSAGIQHDAEFVSKNGTSMATPHVAGVVALHLSKHPTASPADISAILLANTTDGKLTGLGAGSPNKLLNSEFTLTCPRDGSVAVQVAKGRSSDNLAELVWSPSLDAVDDTIFSFIPGENLVMRVVKTSGDIGSKQFSGGIEPLDLARFILEYREGYVTHNQGEISWGEWKLWSGVRANLEQKEIPLSELEGTGRRRIEVRIKDDASCKGATADYLVTPPNGGGGVYPDRASRGISVQ